MRKTLDAIMLDFDAIHCHIKDKPALYKWLFEYAVCALEHQRLDPTSHTAEMDWLIRYKATQMYDVAKQAYWKHKATYMTLQLRPLSDIPGIVEKEYKYLKNNY